MLTRILSCAAAAAFIAGCGGGGSSDGGNGQTPPPPPPQSAAGIWSGTVAQGGSVVNDVSCLVIEAGDLACFMFDPANSNFAGGARGSLQVTDGDQASGSGTSYAAPGYVLADGTSTVANFTITGGTVSERNTMDLAVEIAGESMTVSAAFDPAYDRDSALSTVAASYSAFTVSGDPASFSIDDNGELFTQTQSGCAGNGLVGVIDPQSNGYELSLTVSNCPGLNGSYEGLAVTADLNGTNDVFVFGVFNSSNAIFGAPVK